MSKSYQISFNENQRQLILRMLLAGHRALEKDLVNQVATDNMLGDTENHEALYLLKSFNELPMYPDIIFGLDL